ncbi:MAG: hypothetical protein ACLGIN_16990, partial [Candidatus Sericytochromatia bacterium]
MTQHSPHTRFLQGRVHLAALIAPAVAMAVFAKLTAFNDQISPGGFSLPAALWAIAAIVAVLVGLVWLLPSRFRLAALLVVDLAVTALVLADTLYFRYFGEILPAGAVLHGL